MRLQDFRQTLVQQWHFLLTTWLSVRHLLALTLVFPINRLTRLLLPHAVSIWGHMRSVWLAGNKQWRTFIKEGTPWEPKTGAMAWPLLLIDSHIITSLISALPWLPCAMPLHRWLPWQVHLCYGGNSHTPCLLMIFNVSYLPIEYPFFLHKLVLDSSYRWPHLGH